MKKKKLIPLVAIISLLVLLTVGGTYIFYFNTREDNLKSDVIQEDITSKEEKKEEDVLETNIDSETTDTKTNEENNSSINSNEEVNTSKENTTTKKQENTSSKSSSNNQKNSNNNSNSNSQNNSTPSNNTPVVEEPSCTPKKFVMNWVRADFATFDECKAMGDKYLKEYGYYCYDFVDDCGTRYYMLSLYTDNESGIDFHNIAIPE